MYRTVYDSPKCRANSFEELNGLYRAAEERNKIRRKYIEENYSIDTGCYIKQKWYSWNVTADQEMLDSNPCDKSATRHFWMRLIAINTFTIPICQNKKLFFQ